MVTAENCFLELKWTELYNEIVKLGNIHINKDLLLKMADGYGEGHAIVARIFNIPPAILSRLPAEPEFMQVFGCIPHATAMIHKDGIDRQCALNIPLDGCDNGVMEWFDDGPPFVEKYIETGHTRIRITEHEYVNRKERYNLKAPVSTLVNVPTLVNTNVWHRIDNKANENFRWMASFRFKNNPKFEDIRSRLLAG